MFTFDLTGVAPSVGPVTLSIVGSQGNFQPTFTTTAQITVTLDPTTPGVPVQWAVTPGKHRPKVISCFN